MTYEYQERGGFYGTGRWVVRIAHADCWGFRRAVEFFGTEQECIDYIEAAR